MAATFKDKIINLQSDIVLSEKPKVLNEDRWDLIKKIMLAIIEFFLLNCISGVKFNKFFYLNPIFWKNAWVLITEIVECIREYTEEKNELNELIN